MKKVYADPTLNYSQKARFDFPSDFNLCEKEFYGYYDEEVDADNNAEDTSMEGVFD